MQHDWKAIKIAFEAGDSWATLEEMGPNRSTISRRARKAEWDDTNRGNGHGKKKAKRNSATPRTQHATPKAKGVAREGVASPKKRARKTQVDPELVDEYYQQEQVLAETIEKLDRHAGSANLIADLAGALSRAVGEEILTGDGKLKPGLSMVVIKKTSEALVKLADALYKSNTTYRKNRGLHDKQQLEHSGKIDGAREDTLSTYLGFALQGTGRGASAVSTGVPGGSERVQDMGGESSDREVVPDSN